MDSTEKYDVSNNPSLKRRYDRTIKFLEASLQPPLRILDLGVQNPLSQLLMSKGFEVTNTAGEDFDESPQTVSKYQVDVVTAFEVFEHLLNPLSVIKALPGHKLIASVPLKLWFANAYRHPTDEWDRHYHEFEDWQFDWLLDKAGWKIIRKEKWTSPIKKFGIRPLLRLITDRYYIVEAVRKNPKP
ncbi:MAG TPA: methyltransferase [Cyclobacteriaceae bacterium]|nr:methyltransferase [Cyclobacteriaceae bacterium]